MEDGQGSLVDEVSLVLIRLYVDSGRLGAHCAELGGFVRRLEELGKELGDVRLGTVAEELRKWGEREKRLREGLMNTVQMACWLVEL